MQSLPKALHGGNSDGDGSGCGDGSGRGYPEAVSAYGKVLTLDNPVPGDVIEALRQTGLCLYLTNKYLEAKASYEKAIASKGIQGWQKKDCQNMLKKIEAALSKAE